MTSSWYHGMAHSPPTRPSTIHEITKTKYFSKSFHLRMQGILGHICGWYWKLIWYEYNDLIFHKPMAICCSHRLLLFMFKSLLFWNRTCHLVATTRIIILAPSHPCQIIATHLGISTQSSINYPTIGSDNLWLVIWLATSHYLNQSWLNVTWNKFQWNLNQNCWLMMTYDSLSVNN